MTALAVTNTLSNGQTSDASLWNTNYSDIVTYINNRNSASATWDGFSSSAGISVTATTNQLVFGTTNTTTINSAAPASSRVYTIIDAGTTSNFVMTDSDQTLNISTLTQRKDQNSTTQFLVRNHTASSGANSVFQAYVDSTSGGDPFSTYAINGGGTWAVGADNSDSDRYKITSGAALGGTDLMVIDSTGSVAFGTNTLSGIFTFRKDAAATTDIFLTNQTANSSAQALLSLSVAGGTSGDAYFRCDIGGPTTSWAHGIDNSASDRYVFSYSSGGTAVLGTADTLTLTTGASVVIGNAAIATNATDGFLYIAGGAGAPTGAPTAFTGRYPLYWNTTNKKLYIFDGSWIGGTAPGAWS